MSWKLVAAALVLIASGPLHADSRAERSSTYSNPVINADFPDPDVLQAPDGFYYAYATQTRKSGQWLNIQVARSADLVNWQAVGDALPQKPGWASSTQSFWAPDVVRYHGRYYLYFSAKPDPAVNPGQGMCLGIATAGSPAGPFRDMGHPLQCGEGFVNIDPTEFEDPATGRHWLYWGSGFQPIKVRELSNDLLSFKTGSGPIDLVYPSNVKGAFPVLVEGNWIIRRGGWYYLFYSGDNCCGPKANYAVMVARSRSATGPFQTLEQATGQTRSIILEKSSRWIAPGHNSTITDRAGQDWILYHAVDIERPRVSPSDEMNTRRVMLIDQIHWQNGWPVIGRPSSGPEPRPVTGPAARDRPKPIRAIRARSSSRH